ncbi:hypothetical protein BDP27DRAFT_1412975 [Rhodocollybia butyracea]|uniref:Uncharacterized protein n=1 Tax=Rhodocollybia butyracea TaxID=206335 RepID=A0A9P5UG75_9AGAR|nr:hypothetical protein BDP27DRAFT_1412975 [Rhodocollybia butyracea]
MSYSAIDVNWCISCGSRRTASPGTRFCSPQCEPSHSRPVLRLGSLHDSSDDECDDERYIPVHDASKPYKGIAAWAATIPSGAPPNQISTSPYYHTSSQPKLLRPQSSRPVPPALSRSGSTSASIPLQTPPNASALSSFASHVRNFVSSPSTGFPVRQKTKSKSQCHDLSSSIHQLSRRSSSDLFEESPIDSSFDDAEEGWWVTESDSSIASSVHKRSSAQRIASSPTSRKHHFEYEMYFQPTALPIPVEISSRVSKAHVEWDDQEEYARKSRPRQHW